MERMDIWIVAAAIVLCAALVFMFFGSAVIQTGSWGLSFEASQPRAPEDAAQLLKYGAYYRDMSGEPVLYLTFDAGYENGCTAQILDTLKKHGVKATFFLAGNYLQRNADLVRRMVAEGHTVGNHTVDHPDMTKLSGEDFEAQLKGLESLYESITGSPMVKLYRPPQGLYSEGSLEQAQKLGYKTVFWSLAYADWDEKNQPDPDAALEKLIGRTHSGAVILLHSTSATNAQILDALLTRWEQLGYRFGDLRELCG